MSYRRYNSTLDPKLFEGWNGDVGRQFGVLFPSSTPEGFPSIRPYRGHLPKGLVAYNSLARTET